MKQSNGGAFRVVVVVYCLLFVMLVHENVLWLWVLIYSIYIILDIFQSVSPLNWIDDDGDDESPDLVTSMEHAFLFLYLTQ